MKVYHNWGRICSLCYVKKGPRIGAYYDGTLISTEIVHQTFLCGSYLFQTFGIFSVDCFQKKRNKIKSNLKSALKVLSLRL